MESASTRTIPPDTEFRRRTYVACGLDGAIRQAQPVQHANNDRADVLRFGRGRLFLGTV